jgi:transcriptional regulator with XRE-family HTH domain
LDEFGKAVKLARAKRGWELNDLANRVAEMEAGKPGQKTVPPGRSFLSDIEKGKRSISPPTVGKLIHALGLPETWLDRFLETAPDDADEVTSNDQDVDRLLRMAERDESLPPSAEGLLIGLAQSYAGGNYRDHFTAYTALKSALEVAQALKEKGTFPSNTDSQLDAVLREVARLNDQGDFQAAADLLDDEFARASSAMETVVTRQLDQDRFLNRPKAAADRLIAQLKRNAPPGGVFWATASLIDEWFDRGRAQGDLFDLFVSLTLSRRNLDRAKRPVEKASALQDLAYCQIEIGERSSTDQHLTAAESSIKEALKFIQRRSEPKVWASLQITLGQLWRILGERHKDSARLISALTAFENSLKELARDGEPHNWAVANNNLGNAWLALGELERNPSHLIAAIGVFRQALLVVTPDHQPRLWSGTQNNLGIAYRWLGTLTDDIAELDAAQAAYVLCLQERNKESAPFLWATTQWNLADLALARFDLTADRALLETARHHVLAAREVFVLGSDHQTAECDRLLAQIDAA